MRLNIARNRGLCAFANLLAIMLGLGLAARNQPLYATLGSDTVSTARAEHIRKIEDGFAAISAGENDPPLQVSLQKLMELYRVPGLSIAVIDNFEIDWAKGYGVAAAGSARPVTPETMFQAGSVSKAVAAVGALCLVEQGKIALDEDVNQKLKAWKVSENEFTKHQKATLRRILSHNAGFNVEFFPGYAAGEPVPTLLQVLNGEKPANTDAVEVQEVPGTKWIYSGGGITVAQQLMMDVVGEPFPQFMRETVFDKIGMKNSTYEQPLPAVRVPQAASGATAEGVAIPGNWNIYPEMAAAGLWTTPTDLAKLVIEIANSGRGKSNRLLSEPMARELLKPRMDLGVLLWGSKEHRDRMGLGFFVGDETHPDLFGYMGTTNGFRTVLLMLRGSGKGVAIMSNADVGWPFPIADYVLASVAKEYGWSYQPSPGGVRDRDSALRQTWPNADVTLLAVAKLRGGQAAVRKYRSIKNAAAAQPVVGQDTLIRLSYALSNSGKLPDAIELLKAEVQEYPSYWNAYDSLGEMYARSGEKQLAIQNYEKSIKLNPKNEGGIATLKKLREQD